MKIHRHPAIRRALVAALIALGLPAIARVTLFSVFSIPSSSMSPTLEPGDQILVARYGIFPLPAEPRRGDVVVFRSPHADEEFLVKRIVALPGDHVEIRRGTVRVNGEPLTEPYLPGPPPAESFWPEVLPEHHYFVLGDHRTQSIDSRNWGPLDGRLVVGRAWLVFWSVGDGRDGRTASARSSTSRRQAGRAAGRRLLLSIR